MNSEYLAMAKKMQEDHAKRMENLPPCAFEVGGDWFDCDENYREPQTNINQACEDAGHKNSDF